MLVLGKKHGTIAAAAEGCEVTYSKGADITILKNEIDESYTTASPDAK
ncbi:hypothetical protein H5P28_09310 [Ruficoccus amylovorans]|uniref:Uncharacterized protein n=1 Tax=Ruficoccus amylovorans TaxID=1804625 RepID=A0A842HFZ0_9BACT|nr:hypothetical protein [Ruficoccus amylovorans]MBC2594454.1 hypothetical protein [Ruficoccus amylovorans]